MCINAYPIFRRIKMRVKRVEKFKRLRYKKLKNIVIYAFVLPSLSILMGYVLTLLFILPVVAK